MEILLILAICSAIGLAIDGWRGWALGLLLGPVGVVVAIFTASK